MAGCGATISLLPVSLSLVHIPRPRIQDLIHPILRQVLLPSPTFLNVTCNEIELSVFAEHHALQDFESTARRDTRKLKSISRERSTGREKKASRKVSWEPIEVSHERWNVLQIDSHSGGQDNSGARIHELSAPLAAAGISILYQSSYMSDFIFVKEHRLAEVMTLLGSVGFDLYQSDPDNLTSQLSTLTSPMLSPLSQTADDDASSIHLLDLTSTNPICTENGAVLTRSRSNTDASSKSSPTLLRQKALAPPNGESLDVPAERQAEAEATTNMPLHRSSSHSPAGCEVRMLDPDLTCIGLSDDNADVWGLKVIKLVAYPDLIPVVQTSSGASVRRRSSFVADELMSVSALGVELASASDTSCETETDTEADDTEQPCSTSDTENETEDSRSDSMTRVGDSLVDSRESSQSPVFQLESPRQIDQEIDSEPSDDEHSTYANHSAFPSDPADGAEADVLKCRPSLRHVNTDKTDRPYTKQRPSRRSRSQQASLPPPPPLVPFFSFTRTPEGSSLTAPVNLLASLFPPSERHMVICSDELDFLDSRAASPTGQQASSDAFDDEDNSDRASSESQGMLKCLQIDLTKFGLDKHGLINRYSRTLEDNGINHMYSSTYKTANLLVDKAHARRAQLLLRSC